MTATLCASCRRGRLANAVGMYECVLDHAILNDVVACENYERGRPSGKHAPELDVEAQRIGGGWR